MKVYFFKNFSHSHNSLCVSKGSYKAGSSEIPYKFDSSKSTYWAGSSKGLTRLTFPKANIRFAVSNALTRLAVPKPLQN